MPLFYIAIFGSLYAAAYGVIKIETWPLLRRDRQQSGRIRNEVLENVSAQFLPAFEAAADAPPTPPLKWAGGKRWLVPRLKNILGKTYRENRLIEPFVGGMAVALGLRPSRAILNDVNSHLINFYRRLQDGSLATAMESTSFLNEREAFLQQRERFNALIAEGRSQTAEAACLFYYLNRTCFNGLCRFNQKGQFNVPFGRYNSINYRLDVAAYVSALKAFEFSNQDFESLPLRPNDLVYADPPYDVEFRTYSAGGFSWQDQERLAKWLSRHEGPVIASNQATERIIDLYTGLDFSITYIDAPRRISCDGNRDNAREILAVRNLINR